MAHVQDKDNYIEYSAKPLRLVNGSRVAQDAPQLRDHFEYGAGALNSANPQNWITTQAVNVGANGVVFAPSTSVAGGAVVGSTGSTTADTQELSSKAIIWQPSTMGSNVRLSLDVRAKFVAATTATDGDFFIGFADANTYTSGQAFAISATSTFTTTAPVEFVGFVYSSIPTSGALYSASGNFIGAMSMKNSVAGTLAASSYSKDSNFHRFRVEMDASSNAALYYDGVQIATIAAATTAATKLCPYIGMVNRNSHVLTGTIDLIDVSGDLV